MEGRDVVKVCYRDGTYCDVFNDGSTTHMTAEGKPSGESSEQITYDDDAMFDLKEGLEEPYVGNQEGDPSVVQWDDMDQDEDELIAQED